MGRALENDELLFVAKARERKPVQFQLLNIIAADDQQRRRPNLG
jgi:hypothetical protein